MSFISYAQNFEDVMLWRALKNIENGFYIDVGANDPTIESVTKAFYERGWHGINIEPLPSHHADLLRERPRDINLQCAAGDKSGEIDVWECDVRGWATVSADVVARHMENGHSGTFKKVPVATLTEICAHNVKDEIHFLKIDVEGFEKAVIDGMDFSRFRPWIVVIEATKPNSTQENHNEWEEGVIAADYSLAYCDGLNRFYVAKEHPELLDSLRHPPNVFDRFIRPEQLNAELRALQAAAKAEQAEAASNERLAQLQEVYASWSWKITRPLRGIRKLLSADLSVFKRPTSDWIVSVRQLLRTAVVAGIDNVNKRPVLRHRLNRLVAHFPLLKQRLVRVVQNSRENAQECGARQRAFSTAPENMTPRARQIYQDLRGGIEEKTKGND